MSKEKEQVARDWALHRASINGVAHDPTLDAVADTIIRLTTELTMRDIEWNPDRHRGFGAVDKGGFEWVMLESLGVARIICVAPDFSNTCQIQSRDLTPNGKRYRLVEETNNPKVLKSESDYELAPVGTVVCKSGSRQVFVKSIDGRWEYGGLGYTNRETAEHGIERTVLRWGHGESYA